MRARKLGVAAVVVLGLVFGVGLMASAGGNHRDYCEKKPWKCPTTTTTSTTTTTMPTTTTTEPETTTTTQPAETTTTTILEDDPTTTVAETTTTLPVRYDCSTDGELIEVNPGDPGYDVAWPDPAVLTCEDEETTTTAPAPTTTTPADPGDPIEELPFTGPGNVWLWIVGVVSFLGGLGLVLRAGRDDA